jgi:hypothetical protein
MHVSQAALLSIVLPLALVTVPGATTGGAPKSKENARVVAPQEVLDLGRFKRRFDQEDIPLVTRALHNQGIDNFLCTIDPQTGDVDVSTDEKHIPHFDLKPGSCPNPIQIRGGGAAATLPGGVLGNGFDVTQVDLTFVDVGTPFDPKSPCECAALGPDGILDINVLFDKSDAITILKLDHEADGSSIPLQIVGLGIGSNSIFAATDCAWIQLH